MQNIWISEEEETRLNELLEFLNNDLEAHNNHSLAYTKESLDAPDMLLDINGSFENLKRHVLYQRSKRIGGPVIDTFEFNNPKGISNYINNASEEELHELYKRIEYHSSTLVLYNFNKL
jgi:hypothetical protein